MCCAAPDKKPASMPEELLAEREFTRSGRRPPPPTGAAPDQAAQTLAPTANGNGHADMASARGAADVEMGVVSGAGATNGKVCRPCGMFCPALQLQYVAISSATATNRLSTC